MLPSTPINEGCNDGLAPVDGIITENVQSMIEDASTPFMVLNNDKSYLSHHENEEDLNNTPDSELLSESEIDNTFSSFVKASSNLTTLLISSPILHNKRHTSRHKYVKGIAQITEKIVALVSELDSNFNI